MITELDYSSGSEVIWEYGSSTVEITVWLSIVGEIGEIQSRVMVKQKERRKGK